MAEPPDQMPAAAGRGHLRASHADREHAIEVLKAAYVQGMLTKDELDARLVRPDASARPPDRAGYGRPAATSMLAPMTSVTALGVRGGLEPFAYITAAGTDPWLGL